jgi:hypothetical protein
VVQVRSRNEVYHSVFLLVLDGAVHGKSARELDLPARAFAGSKDASDYLQKCGTRQNGRSEKQEKESERLYEGILRWPRAGFFLL